MSKDMRNERSQETTTTGTGLPTESTGAADPFAWGPLRIHEELGRGSFGRVYRAWDPLLTREVALKLIDTPTTTVASADSLVREAQLLARVRHANVVSVYGAARERDTFGIWMELIRGRSLAQVVKTDGPMGADEATLIGINLCHAIAAVHAAGVVHRDIKTHNVMRELGGRIVLMDFGAGRVLLEPARTSDRIGTPVYMAPEVLLGAPASFASDVYSLGVLLYYLVTAAYPYDGRSAADVALAHTCSPQHSLVDLRPDLPDRFVSVVERSLARDPADRFQSAASMLRELSARPWSGSTAALNEEAGPAPAQIIQTPAKSSPIQSSLSGVSDRMRVGTALAAAVCVGVLAVGYLTTMAFNATLDRPEAFTAESLRSLWAWGAMALVPPLIYMVTTAFVFAAARWIGSALRRVRPHTSRRFVTKGAELRRSVEKYTSFATLSNVLAIVHLVVVIAVVLAFRGLFAALFDYATSDTAVDLSALRPENYESLSAQRALVDVAIFVFGLAWWRLWTRVKNDAERTAVPVSIYVGIGANVLLLLLIVVPYRVAVYNGFERIDFGGARCYQVGETADRLLLHCPDLHPPRNRIVQRGDPALRHTGIVESVFTPSRAKP